MATVTRYVDTDVVGGLADGTSWANAYSDLNTWETAEQTDLVSDGDSHIVNLRASSGTADTTATTIDGWTTGASNTITITQNDFPVDGIFTDSEYVLHNDDSDSNALTTREDYLIINKLQVKVTGTSTNTRRGISAGTLGTSIHKYSKIIVKGIYSGTGVGYGFLISDADLTVTFDNCIVYGIISSDNPSDTNFRAYETGGTTMSFYNCVAYGSYIGFSRTAGSMTCVNCISGNNTDDFNGTITATYCCSDEVKAGTGNVQPISGAGDWTRELTDPDNGDFTLIQAGNCADGGTDNPAPGLYDDDIIGTIRTSPWDIGAFDFTPSAGSGLVTTGAGEYWNWQW